VEEMDAKEGRQLETLGGKSSFLLRQPT